ncbi:MAG: DNA starvation/stationary phase protection protein Dps [Alphaproteobacteria bacterium]
MDKQRNGLPEDIRRRMTSMLNSHLAAAIDLHGQVKQAHWNIRGRQFIGLHELFDTIAGDVDEWSDLIAERAGALGGIAAGTVQVAAAQSYLLSYPLTIADGEAHASALANALAAFAGRVRGAIDEAAGGGDAVTADVLTGIVRAADQAVWKLDSHLDPAQSILSQTQGASL